MDVNILAHSNALHLQQIYTGFSLLKRMGIINLRQKVVKKNDKNNNHFRKILRIILNNKIKIVYDLWDGNQIDKELYQWSDIYYKRSYLKTKSISLNKVLPLGLYYRVYPGFIDWYQIQRSLRLSFRSEGLYNFYYSGIKKSQSVQKLQNIPDFYEKPKIIFISRLWPPNTSSNELNLEREKLNNLRVQCILKLKKHFRENFYGGLEVSSFTKKKYSSLLVSERKIKRPSYLKKLKYFSIGLTTNGLRGSIGAKLGEYVAMGMAIVTEYPNYFIDENFSENKNYLSFTNSEQCIDQVEKLFYNKKYLRKLRINNTIYYQRYLRPDLKILNTLLIALEKFN